MLGPNGFEMENDHNKLGKQLAEKVKKDLRTKNKSEIFFFVFSRIYANRSSTYVFLSYLVRLAKIKNQDFSWYRHNVMRHYDTYWYEGQYLFIYYYYI